MKKEDSLFKMYWWLIKDLFDSFCNHLAYVVSHTGPYFKALYAKHMHWIEVMVIIRKERRNQRNLFL